MVEIRVVNTPIHDHKSGCYGFMVVQGEGISPEFKDFVEKHNNHSAVELVKKHMFEGKALDMLELPMIIDGDLAYIVLVGLGVNPDMELYRRALSKLVRAAQARKSDALAFHAPVAAFFGVDSLYFGQQSAIMIEMAQYHFDDYITDIARKKHEVSLVIVSSLEADSFQRGVIEGQIIGNAVNKARYWIDLPPSVLTPPHLADKALEIAQANDLKITIYHEQEVLEMGMGGLAGVSSGSHIDCRFVAMEYKSLLKDAPTIALVGKGITFDSGGLSIKPADSMEDMKDDMSGAAAVIAAMEALAKFKPEVNVIGLMGLTENLPGTSATKPGDIITFYNGKTAEVKNTDAEGRLILADVLSYAAKHYKPDAIIDVATLTGACAYALGPFYTGLISQSDGFANQVLAAANRAGEKMWRLPMDNDYKKAIETPLADLANIGKGSYRAGWMTAAFFLQPFVDNIPWVHLDIAGTAFNVPDLPYFRTGGGTGASVRTLIELARTFKK